MRALAVIGLTVIAPASALGQPPSFAPAGYPDHCRREAAPVEKVTLEFTLSPTGKPERISVVESTNRCFNRPSIRYVSDWFYQPPDSGGPQNRPQRATATLTFDKDLAARSKRADVSAQIRKDLDTIAQFLNEGGDGAEALNQLNTLSRRHGTLIASETVAHAILTAIALQDQGDVDAALAVLRQTQKKRRELGLSRRAQELLTETISDLERLNSPVSATRGAER